MQLLEFLSASDLEAIHQATMEILQDIGIHFPHQEALDIFKKHGYKVEDQLVFLEEKQILEVIKDIPSKFTIQARNPEHNVIIGDGSPVFVPGYGAPFLIDPVLGKRDPTFEDYENLVRLAHVLPNQDMSGHLMVEPQDIPVETVNLRMVDANIRLSDKAFIGSTDGREGAQYTMDLIKILFGDKASGHFTTGLINPLSPLRYSTDMLDALLVYSRANQPVVIASLIMAGSTGPITLAGLLAQQNAELLSGIVLTQLVNPGLPVIYGTASTNVDMKTGALAIGSPELSLCLAAHGQLARKYGLASRGGGALTDSSTLDAQAGYESMFSLYSTINSGIDFVLHAAGILSSFLAFSYEKFVMDDELCGMLRHLWQGMEVTPETLALEVIKNVGHDGHYLGEPQTLERCRTEFWLPAIGDRSGMEAWWKGEQQDTSARSTMRWKELLESYSEPKLDPIINKQIQDYLGKMLQ
ncbi:MAG: trimethylamine methyltransferase family protein [Anaerolineales bacterium]|nr:trimethylamine methyltransferase family protein [Anaerolineales bacterium]